MKKLVLKFHPSILFLTLMETKKKQDYMEEKRRLLKFQQHYYVQSVEHAGGLTLLWIADLPLRIITSSRFLSTFSLVSEMFFYVPLFMSPLLPSREGLFGIVLVDLEVIVMARG